ncbi:MAG: hypothetical protein NTZ37_08630 [Methanoregula sp.]|nr:hypothetical protein [Methanoregula sp.]
MALKDIFSDKFSNKLNDEKKELKDIEKFCNEVISWKVQATKKDEIFNLFKDNPYYLFGFFTYKTLQNEKINQRMQSIILLFSATALILAFVAVTMTFYQSINKPEFPWVATSFVFASLGIYYLFSKFFKKMEQ